MIDVTLPMTSDAPAIARDVLETALGDRVPRARVQDALLVVTELVTNAVVHGEGKVTMRAELRGGVLQLEVVDQGSGMAAEVKQEAGPDGGWGLRIVDALALNWGAFEGTTHVWADLPID